MVCRVAGAAPRIEIQTAFCHAEIHVSRAILFCVIVIKVGDAANTKPIFTSLINQQVIKKWMQPAAKWLPNAGRRIDTISSN